MVVKFTEIEYRIRNERRTKMGGVLKKVLRLTCGISLCGSATVFMLNSNIGLLPWDVFHEGISKVMGITTGQASIIVSLIVFLLSIAVGEKVGIGSIVNVFLAGWVIDFLNYINIIPKADDIFNGIIMVIIGLLLLAYGCYLYMGCGLGYGPRDSLLVGLNKKLNKSINLIKTAMEVTVLLIGILLGGSFGVGTVISALGTGYAMEMIFKLKKFDVAKLKQKSLMDSFHDFKAFFSLLSTKKSSIN